MQLNVILGPPGAGKAGRAIGALRAAVAEGRDAFLCVPGAVDRARFLRELAAGDDGVLVGAEVGTFDQLVTRVAGSPPVRRTDRAMERIVVRDALLDVAAFARSAEWSGFVDTARVHVDRLRRARVWGGVELERVESELPGAQVEHWRSLEQRVGHLLDERHLRDDAWFETRASMRLRSGDIGVDAVVVYGFEHLPPGRVELLERLARHVPVTVTLPWRPGRLVHERAADLRDRWRAAGAYVEELDAVPVAVPMLEWLGSELFEQAPSQSPVIERDPAAPAPVAFVDCCGATQEAEEVVREVALLHARGLAWDDIVVASADVGRGAELLQATFDRAGIPVRIQARRTAIDVPVGRALHELLRGIVDQDALRVAGALRAPVFGLDRRRVDECELRLRRARHRDGRSGLAVPALRSMVTEPIRAMLGVAPDDPRTVELVRTLLGSLRPADLGELDLLRGVSALVEGLVVAAGDQRGVTLVDVRDAIGAFPLTVPDRSDAGTVVVAALDDLRSVSWDAVVLHGMHLSAFRALVDDEHEAPSAARDLLHLAVTRARRTLRVVRQATSSDGAHQAPSPAWQELRRLLPDAPLRTRRLGEVVVDPANVRLASERAISVALAGGRGVPVDAVDDALARLVDSHRRRARLPYAGDDVAAEQAGRATVPVTDVERYATCSARWFIERRLRDSDPDDDRSRIVDGSIAHALLQRLVPEARRGDLPAQDVLRVRAFELLPEVVDDVDDARHVSASRLERIVDHVVLLLEREAAWPVPDRVEVERSFGREAPDSIGAGLDVDGVELVGRIDRIDRYGDELVLHDYKYGSSPRPAARLVADRNLQLLVYWLALRGAGDVGRPIGAMYRAVTDGGAPSGAITNELRTMGFVPPKTRSALDDEARERLLDDTRELVASTVSELRSGVVRPLADASECPTHCRLQLVCRVGEATP